METIFQLYVLAIFLNGIMAGIGMLAILAYHIYELIEDYPIS